VFANVVLRRVGDNFQALFTDLAESSYYVVAVRIFDDYACVTDRIVCAELGVDCDKLIFTVEIA
ncbi:hypothetical protein Tco_0648462, partial [Tanacetum coccineum]